MEQHFFLASWSQWVTTAPERSLRDALKIMERDKKTFTLWLVPGPHDTPYDIKMFQPRVPGAVGLETWIYKNGRFQQVDVHAVEAVV